MTCTATREGTAPAALPAPVVDHRAAAALRVLRLVAETTVPVEAPLSPPEEHGIEEASHVLRCPTCAAGWLR